MRVLSMQCLNHSPSGTGVTLLTFCGRYLCYLKSLETSRRCFYLNARGWHRTWRERSHGNWPRFIVFFFALHVTWLVQIRRGSRRAGKNVRRPDERKERDARQAGRVETAETGRERGEREKARLERARNTRRSNRVAPEKQLRIEGVEQQ